MTCFKQKQTKVECGGNYKPCLSGSSKNMKTVVKRRDNTASCRNLFLHKTKAHNSPTKGHQRSQSVQTRDKPLTYPCFRLGPPHREQHTL